MQQQWVLPHWLRHTMLTIYATYVDIVSIWYPYWVFTYEPFINHMTYGVRKYISPVWLINRNSFRAASFLVFKTMTYLNRLKPSLYLTLATCWNNRQSGTYEINNSEYKCFENKCEVSTSANLWFAGAAFQNWWISFFMPPCSEEKQTLDPHWLYLMLNQWCKTSGD